MKKTYRKLVLCMLIVMAALFCISCGNSSEDETTSVESVDINISIDFPEKAKLPDLRTLPFRVEEETTVLQAVELYGTVNNISILVDTTASSLEGIDGVINGITLKKGEWQYKVNGKETSKSISEAVLKNGDHLELIYTNKKEPQ